MRFLQSEYKPIIEVIKKNGFEEQEFSFVKKRGRLNIIHTENSQTFFFHRKTETVLNESRQWEKQSSFQFGSEKEELWSDTFDTVLAALSQWLAKLPKD